MIFAATILQAGGLGSALGSPLIMMVVVMGIFYVMLILPQQRQRKKTQEMLGALKTGDKVITNAGIYGTINGIDVDTVILKIAEQVKIRIARWRFLKWRPPKMRSRFLLDVRAISAGNYSGSHGALNVQP